MMQIFKVLSLMLYCECSWRIARSYVVLHGTEAPYFDKKNCTKQNTEVKYNMV